MKSTRSTKIASRGTPNWRAKIDAEKSLDFSAFHFFRPSRNSFDGSKPPPYNAAVFTIDEFIPRHTTDALRGPARGNFNLGNGKSVPAQL
jgi:hypothetical protein